MKAAQSLIVSRPLALVPCPRRARQGATPWRTRTRRPRRAAAPQAVAAPPGAAGPAAAPSAAPATPNTFSWTKQWYPALPIAYLDPRRPNGPIEILGLSYVVWFDAPARRWRAFEDRCPHRMARLSQGRVVDGGGALQCSYHGWEFDGAGGCARIPQIADPKAAASARASPRSCARAFPTHETGGLLFIWLEAGAAAEAEAATAPPPRVAGGNEGAEWSASLAPNDARFWMEQGMDPSHAPFLHHGQLIFDMRRSKPMDAEVVPAVDARGGFVWRHGTYSTDGIGGAAEREFTPPCSNVSRYEVSLPGGGKLPVQVQTFVVPVRPGVCRTFFKFGGFQPKGPLQRLMARALPREVLHALANDPSIYDQDVVIMESQQCNLFNGQQQQAPASGADAAGSSGAAGDGHADGGGHGGGAGAGSGSAYQMYARADEGVRALGEWLRRAGYGAMWASRLGPRAAAGKWEPWPLERLLDRRARHVDSCALCQRAEAHARRAAAALAAAAAAAAALAAAAVAAAAGVAAAGAGGAPAGPAGAAAAAAAAGAVLAAAAAALAAARGRLLEWAEYNFVSGVRRWRAKGGLSLARPGGAGPIAL